MLRVLGAVAIPLVVAGCATARFIPTAEAYPPRAANCAIEIYSAAPPHRAYEEIGILEGEGSLWKADLEDVIPRLREEACLAGGDAMIILSANRYVTGEELVDEELYAVATVIRWAGE